MTAPTTTPAPTLAVTGLDAAVILDAGKRITLALAPRHNLGTVGWGHVLLAEEVGRDLGRGILAGLVADVEQLAETLPHSTP